MYEALATGAIFQIPILLQLLKVDEIPFIKMCYLKTIQDNMRHTSPNYNIEDIGV